MPAGRPVGTTETVERLLKDEIKKWLKLSQDVREGATTQIKAILKIADDDNTNTSLDTRLKVLDGLKTFQTAAFTTIKVGLSLLNDEPAKVEETISDEDALLALRGGNG